MSAAVTVVDITAKRWLTKRELADELRVSVSTVNRMVAEGMPSETWGRRLRRFNLADVERWRRGRAA